MHDEDDQRHTPKRNSVEDLGINLVLRDSRSTMATRCTHAMPRSIVRQLLSRSQNEKFSIVISRRRAQNPCPSVDGCY
jgi:hypothetical protein